MWIETMYRLRGLRHSLPRKKTDDAFNQGLSARKAAYIQFLKPCLKDRHRHGRLRQLRRTRHGLKPKVSAKTGRPVFGPCATCPSKAIDRSVAHAPEELLQVDSIVVATGFSVMPKKNSRPTHPTLPTSAALQLGALISATGPTGGSLLRPSDGQKCATVTFVSCVGSRDQNHHSYCSTASAACTWSNRPVC